MCIVMPMIASGMKTGSAKGLCNRQDTQRCTSGRIGTDGNSVMISRTKRMTPNEHQQATADSPAWACVPLCAVGCTGDGGTGR